MKRRDIKCNVNKAGEPQTEETLRINPSSSILKVAVLEYEPNELTLM